MERLPKAVIAIAANDDNLLDRMMIAAGILLQHYAFGGTIKTAV